MSKHTLFSSSGNCCQFLVGYQCNVQVWVPPPPSFSWLDNTVFVSLSCVLLYWLSLYLLTLSSILLTWKEKRNIGFWGVWLLTHLAPDQPLPFRYGTPCRGKYQMIPVYNFKKPVINAKQKFELTSYFSRFTNTVLYIQQGFFFTQK